MNVPKLRFKEFDGEWEERKLGEVATFYDEKRIPIDSGKRTSGEYPYYGATGIIDYVENYIFDGEYILLAEDGANIITRNSPIAYITKGKFWVNNHAHIMKMLKGSNDFLLELLERQNYEKYNSGTAQPKLNGQIIKNLKLYFPSKEEQQKIGQFFNILNKKIKLQQQKIDLLQEQKKGFLQKMFPKLGETQPEIRFAGFTGDWEQCKLEEVANIFDGTHQTPKYTATGVKFVSVENIATLETNKFISQEAYDKEYSKKQAEKGDVLMTRIGDIGTAKVIETEESLAYYVTLALLKPNKVDSDFLAWLISSPEVQRNIWKRTLHIAFPKKINLGEINKIEMMVPNNEEQTKIGAFFKQLNDTIALHQQKITTLKEQKKGFMQKMFI